MTQGTNENHRRSRITSLDGFETGLPRGNKMDNVGAQLKSWNELSTELTTLLKAAWQSDAEKEVLQQSYPTDELICSEARGPKNSGARRRGEEEKLI